MIMIPGSLPGVYEITLSSNPDLRGYFQRLYDEQTFQEFGLHCNWVQENRSFSRKKGTIRGLHMQFGVHAETKLIRVSKGAIYDVFVDLRKDSPTFCMWDAVLLTEDNQRMVYIPKGFAHGFCTLVDDTEVVYKVDHVYSPAHEGGVYWKDETLRINWPILKPVISNKDQRLPSLEVFLNQHEDYQNRGRST
ncbi:dTDP-4-dehydrorhamnose 3,5-epimerase [Paenibacillus hexagrammi]|uniref:dTDP-4-dehydrorhamnose 3,5-epimerase n=1 Tax=Paenibacillus hexagrammi TaxID=2908839 RepID=A0ABY3SN68_9BACL|nr:dTDP-4-dehydrorhamnose 3,5-epimerase [Paenibacillus sp. YPD9-1]UJF35498.1 dTDP-4-dehydrorhamnose 3,5-epimerase [Paenibacillus sp. YPD9-1]